MDRMKCRQLREVLTKAIESVVPKGMKLIIGNATFDNTMVKYPVSFVQTDEKGEAITEEAKNFTNYSDLYDLKPEHLFKRFKSNNKIYKLMGLNMRSPKYPLAVEDVATGKRYKFVRVPVSAFID